MLSTHPNLPLLTGTEAAASRLGRSLSTGVRLLDQALSHSPEGGRGGLPLGTLSEWGLPLGQLGREVIVSILSQATAAGFWCLWVSERTSLIPFPPAWKARGLNLERLCWVNSERPVAELRPLLLNPFFRVIVFDAPRHLTLGDAAFLASQTRRHNRVTLVLRDRLLRADAGTVWARLRLNIWQDDGSGLYVASVIRGGRAGRFEFDLPSTKGML